MGSEIWRWAKKAFWFPFALTTIPFICWGWNFFFPMYKKMTMKDAWDSSWKSWRSL